MQPNNWTVSIFLFFTLASQALYGQTPTDKSKPEPMSLFSPMAKK
jgi:hypothetical protein